MEFSKQNLPDSFILTSGLLCFYGIRSRATFIKKEREGSILSRETLPDGRKGNWSSDLERWKEETRSAMQ